MLIALITCFLTAVSNAELRTWTAVNGKQVKAEFVSSLRGNVKLRLESGKVFEIPRDKLSKKDHEFIANLYKVESVGGGVKKRPKSSVSQLRFKIADGVATVVEANKIIKNVIVPSEVNAIPVKIIGKEAFKDFQNLVSVTLPESIISIEEGAFEDCKKLETINIPEGVLTIQAKTFYACQRLKTIELHDGIIEIGDYAFEYCGKVVGFKLPKNLKRIGTAAFRYSNIWSHLGRSDTVKFPVGLEEIGIEAFGFHRSRPVGNFVFYENIDKIGFRAFSWPDYHETTFTFLGDAPEFGFTTNVERFGIEEGEPLRKGKIRIKRSSMGWGLNKKPDLPIEYID